ncbi:hypothetical protein WN51_12686 [Melipona quadrifasciata]|uniref:Uncharacterized protein n=1 Tax=Melipona quadrifasciata TaxID=166423 RepID=A0A0N1ITM5_9HYME|nr:hypothetical protein WN51_12686 [Melipona quadrifasciata]
MAEPFSERFVTAKNRFDGLKCFYNPSCNLIPQDLSFNSSSGLWDCKQPSVASAAQGYAYGRVESNTLKTAHRRRLNTSDPCVVDERARGYFPIGRRVDERRHYANDGTWRLTDRVACLSSTMHACAGIPGQDYLNRNVRPEERFPDTDRKRKLYVAHAFQSNPTDHALIFQEPFTLHSRQLKTPLHVPLLQTMRGGIVPTRCRAQAPIGNSCAGAFSKQEGRNRLATQLTPRSVPSAN